MENNQREPSIETITGKLFHYLVPDPAVIDILDIAAGLAKECRFNGQCKGFYSVAQHSVIMARIIDEPFKMEALLHDAHEAYGKDLPSPLKWLLPEYKEIMDRVDKVIRERFGLPFEESPEVKELDLRMLATERNQLKHSTDNLWTILEGVTPLDIVIQPWGPEKAEAEFLREFTKLLAERG